MTRTELDRAFAGLDHADPVVHSALYRAALAAALGEDDEQDFDSPECPECGGPGMPLGSLGSLHWYRCRNCGWDFNA